MRNSGFAPSRRRTRCSPTPSAVRRTTASGTPAFAEVGSRPWTPISAASRTSSPRSSARRSSAREKRRAAAHAGPDVAAQVEIDLADSVRGVSLGVGVRAARSCEACAGSGAAPGTSPVTCPGCGGAGVVQQVSRTVLGQIVRSGTCPRCDGAGRIVETPCERCDGDGRTLEDVPLELDIPAGIHDGQRIRVRGQGHAGTLGGPSGDVYVTVRVRPLEGVERDGDDLHVHASVTMTEAALGSTVTVPTPEGPFEVELAPGTQPGAVHAVRGRGMPSLETGRRGDLLVSVQVRVPTRLTGEQRAEILRLEDELGADAYRDEDDGFLGRLKSAFR